MFRVLRPNPYDVYIAKDGAIVKVFDRPTDDILYASDVEYCKQVIAIRGQDCPIQEACPLGRIIEEIWSRCSESTEPTAN